MPLQVRKTHYRDKDGFLVCGRLVASDWPQGIFFDTESQAREYVRRVKLGEASSVVLREIWGFDKLIEEEV